MIHPVLKRGRVVDGAQSEQPHARLDLQQQQPL